MSLQPRVVIFKGSVGKLRTAQFQGREHLVISVTAAMEGVVHAANSEFPELVLASELAIAPEGWNGRPVVVDHPFVNGNFVSAGDPTVLEREGIGTIFGAHVDGPELRFDTWLDSLKTADGSKGGDLVKRVNAGENVEVSIGAFMQREEKVGVFKGKKFFAIWRGIVPDHFAFLSAGSTGACSNQMGCGVLMAAQVNDLAVLKQENQMSEPKKEEKTETRSLRERFLSMLKFEINAKPEDPSDDTVHRMLWDSLFSSEAAFDGIVSVFSNDGIVIYAVRPNGEVQFFQREFEITDNKLLLKKGRQEVNIVTRFEPLSSGDGKTASPSAASSGCGCKEKKDAVTASTGEPTMTKEAIDKLITAGKFKEADRVWLEQVPEAHANRFDEPKQEPKTEPEPVVNTKKEEKQLTADEYIASAPVELQETLREGMRVSAAKKASMVSLIKNSDRNPYSDAELAAMSMNQLEKLVKMSGIKQGPQDIDYTGKSVSRAASENDEDSAPPAPDFVGRFAAKK